jgi:hypothetical protein
MADQQNMPANFPAAAAQNPAAAQHQNVAPLANQQGNNIQVAYAQAVQGANGGINLKVEKAKLPEFWGQKEKDSIAVAEFAKRIDWIMSAMVGQTRKLNTTSAWLFVVLPTSGSSPWLLFKK